MKFQSRKRARGFWRASACIGAFACAQAASGASAAAVDVTFSGKVLSGVDAQKQFGGGDLGGDTYVATYVFDGSRGALVNKGTGGETLTGDFSAGETDPLISASVTLYKAGAAVGSLTVRPQAQYENELDAFPLGPPAEVNAQAFYLGAAHSIAIDNLLTSSATPTSLFAPANFSGTPGGFGDSVIEEFTGKQVSELVYLAPTHATFTLPRTPAAFDLPSASAAPEPSTWALLVAGVGAVGAALRLSATSRRRRNTATA